MKEFSFEDRDRLRAQYEKFEEAILSGERLDVYSLWPHTWLEYMSPIERNFFSWLRDNGVQSFWPQYPCGKYFMDFASPTRKICVELDGKEWHQDQAKDRKREDHIRSQGYRVYRLTGKESFDLVMWDNRDSYDENGHETSYEHPLSEYMSKIVRED